MCHQNTSYHTETYKGFVIDIFTDIDAPNPIKEYDHAGEFVRFDKYGRAVKDHCSKWSSAPNTKDGFMYDVFEGEYKTGLLFLFQVGRYQRLTWWKFSDFKNIENETFDGFFYLSAKTIREEWGTKWQKYGNKGPKLHPYKFAEKYTAAVLSEIRDWYEGDVYGYVVSRIDDEGEKQEVESCWGFIGEYKSSGWYVLDEARQVCDYQEQTDLSAADFERSFMCC